MPIAQLDLGTHLVNTDSLSPFTKLLRASKVDELPQLLNVLKGDMSIVGPRPCLVGQVELINARQVRGVFSVRPGITGLGQVLGVDMATPNTLSLIDQLFVERSSLLVYFQLIFTFKPFVHMANILKIEARIIICTQNNFFKHEI